MIKKILIFLITPWILYAQSIPIESSAEFADDLHIRITGHKASTEKLNTMKEMIDNNDLISAALVATDEEAFYSATVKSHYQSTTNEDYTARAFLNDAVATIIGFIRDEKDFREILYGDTLYVIDDNTLASYNGSNNDHYEDAEIDIINLKEKLVEASISGTLNIPADKVAGVMTSRSWGEAFYQAGTNRRVYQALFESFLCTSLESARDVSIPDNFIRRDVSRAPAGDVSAFVSDCKGCHTHMDRATNAFNYFDYNDLSGRLNYNPGTVAPKINLNIEYQFGDVPTNDQWSNMWQYSAINQDPFGFYEQNANSGYGPQGLGKLYAQSDRFNECAAKRAFEMVCYHQPQDKDLTLINRLTVFFKENNYNMKKLIAQAAVECLITKWQNNEQLSEQL